MDEAHDTFRLDETYGFVTGLAIGAVNEFLLPPGMPAQLRLAESTMFGGIVGIFGTRVTGGTYSATERTRTGVACGIGVACGHELLHILKQYL